MGYRSKSCCYSLAFFHSQKNYIPVLALLQYLAYGFHSPRAYCILSQYLGGTAYLASDTLSKTPSQNPASLIIASRVFSLLFGLQTVAIYYKPDKPFREVCCSNVSHPACFAIYTELSTKPAGNSIPAGFTMPKYILIFLWRF